jgi:hypothetical protein
MKKLWVSALALSVMMIAVSAMAQDTMGQAPPNAAASAPLKNIKGTVKFDGDKAAFVADNDQKSWDVMNPEALKGHDGHHVQLSAHVYADKGTIHVMSVKMLQ